MKILYKKLLLILLPGVTMSACKKFVDIAPSPQLIATDAIFSNDNTALSAVSGVYVQMRSGSPSFANGGIGIYTGLTADEIYNTSSSLLTIHITIITSCQTMGISVISGLQPITPYTALMPFCRDWIKATALLRQLRIS
ncbi:hypothetical protein ACFJIV_32950 [Mucilaginibacter sp. UC70_90]